MANVLLWVESGMRCAILNMEISLNESSNVRVFPLEGDVRTAVQMASLQGTEKKSVALARRYFSRRSAHPSNNHNSLSDA